MTMKPLKLRRRFEQTLSEGQGMQLLWLIIAILIVFFVFWGIAALFFRDHSMGWQDVLSLFLDPGGFGGKGNHDTFRLLATIFGLFLFSALLISVVSNIFENVAVSFRDGHSRYHHSNHVLVLGGGNLLTGIVCALLEEKDERDIVVLTTLPVNELRSRLFTMPFLDKETEKALRKQLTIYYGKRDNDIDLREKDLASKASCIYIIGEDSEPDHDSVNIRCCKTLQAICTGDVATPIKCFMVLQEPNTTDIYDFVKDTEKAGSTNLRTDIVDANEHLAQQVLVNGTRYPRIDFRANLEPGIRAQDPNYVHLIISGTSDMARAFALTATHICHFPNFVNGRRSVITFIDSGMKSKMNAFVYSMSNLFKLSHYKYVSYDGDGKEKVTVHKPDSQYGDFLDIEWEFIDADFCSPEISALLEKLSKDTDRSVSIALCRDTQEENTFAAIHLPHVIYEKGFPIFVYQKHDSEALEQARLTGQFGNIHAFGMESGIQDDPLFRSRSIRGQRVNFVYNQAFGEIKYPDEESAWFVIPEAHKFSSIYSANAMTVRARSFGLGEGRTVADLSDEERVSIYEVEHRRWMISALILGYKPMDKAYLDKWKERRLSPDKDVQEAAKQEFKSQKADHFIHYDITPYDDLLPNEKVKDKTIIDKMEYILGE